MSLRARRAPSRSGTNRAARPVPSPAVASRPRATRRGRATLRLAAIVVASLLWIPVAHAQTLPDSAGSNGASAATSGSPRPADHAVSTPRLELHGFFDINLSAGTMRSSTGDSSSFQATLGQFDLYMLSRLSERISFLGELVIESEAASGSRIDLERAHVRYAIADWLQLIAGRTHSPISLWNVVYHHGALLEPTVARPGPVQFEDEGGLLPLHAVGFELGGHLPAGPMRLQYTASVSNGRGAAPDEVQITQDQNRDKALGLALSWMLEQPFALTWGGALHHDRIPSPDPVEGELDQNIFSAHAAARTDRFEALAEYFVVRDRDRVTGQSFDQRAWYGVVSSGSGRWHPYAAAERVKIDGRDRYFGPTLGSMQRVIGGLRLDVAESNVVKLEYRNTLQAGVRAHEIVLQTAFTF